MATASPAGRSAPGAATDRTAILLEYALAPPAIAVVHRRYVNALVGIDGWVVYLGSYLIFVGIHLWALARR